MQTLSKRDDAIYFVQPVTYNHMRMMNIPHYPDIIKKLMDLRTTEEKLKSAKYLNVDDCVADFAQIVENTIKFNGPDHGITKDAFNLKVSFDRDVKELLSHKYSAQIKKAQPIFTRGNPHKFQNLEAELKEARKRKRLSPAAIVRPEEPENTDSDDEPFVRRRVSTGRPRMCLP